MRPTACISAAVLTVCGLVCFATDARAQEPAPAAPAGAPAAGAPAGAPGAKPQDADPDEHGRLRIGFNFLNGGIGSGGGLSGPAIGATFKIGYQMSRLLGIYGNISPFVWLGSSDAKAGGKDVKIGAIAGTQLAPLISVSPVDLFEVAAGPSLDYLSGGSVDAGPAGSAGGFSGVYFGVHGKVALHLGGRNEETGRRKGFTIEGNIHPSFTPGAAVTFFTLGLGFDWF